jgi:hypothetical protein
VILRIGAALLCAAVLLDTRGAEACSAASNEPHAADSTLDDTTLPDSAALDVSVLVQRAKSAQREGCSTSETSCDDVGSIQLLLNEPATDDQTSEENMGYQVDVVDGTLPGGLSLPATPVRALNGTLFFHWLDDDTDAQEIVAFSVTLTPIDEAGNAGSPSDPIRIFDPGSAEGCAVAEKSSSFDAAPLLAALAGLAFGARRRHPRG